jgi:PAS domain S-box-containing protein
MPLKLKLTHKALVLISIPIVIGLVFFQILFLALNEVESEATRAEHAELVLKRGTKLTEDLYAAGACLVKYGLSKHEDLLASYKNLSSEIPKEMQILETSLKESPTDLATAIKLNKTAELALVYMEEARRLIELGEDSQARERIIAMKPIIEEVLAGVKELIKPYVDTKDYAARAEETARKNSRNIVIAGLVLNVLLAAGITIMFNQGITRRLATLMDNIQRFRTGAPLNQPIAGTDEISSLDQTFHDMAAIITRATEQLKSSEARIRAVIEGLPVGVILVSEDGEIGFMNPKAELLFGYATGTSTSQPLSRLFDEQAKGSASDFKIGIIAKALNRIEEFTGLRADGTTVPIELTVSRFSGPEEKGFLIGVQDITERHELDRMKQEFVAMVSHDLRAPLTSIGLSFELISMGKYGALTDEGLKKVKRDQTNIERLVALINDLLDIDKIESGRMELDLRVGDVHEIFERSVAAVWDLADGKGIKIKIAPEHFDVVADADRIVQVLVNLMSNSIKFSPENSYIEISSLPMERSLEIRVTDHGRGIPADKKDLVFERFKQVSRDDATKLGGSGLGLAICKAIVEAHKGSIGVESEEGIGTTFWFKLPRPLPNMDDA